MFGIYVVVPRSFAADISISYRFGLIETSYIKLKARGRPIDIGDLSSRKDDELAICMTDYFWHMIKG